MSEGAKEREEKKADQLTEVLRDTLHKDTTYPQLPLKSKEDFRLDCSTRK